MSDKNSFILLSKQDSFQLFLVIPDLLTFIQRFNYLHSKGCD